jgi:hypothetical protein
LSLARKLMVRSRHFGQLNMVSIVPLHHHVMAAEAAAKGIS